MARQRILAIIAILASAVGGWAQLVDPARPDLTPIEHQFLPGPGATKGFTLWRERVLVHEQATATTETLALPPALYFLTAPSGLTVLRGDRLRAESLPAGDYSFAVGQGETDVLGRSPSPVLTLSAYGGGGGYGGGGASVGVTSADLTHDRGPFPEHYGSAELLLLPGFTYVLDAVASCSVYYSPSTPSPSPIPWGEEDPPLISPTPPPWPGPAKGATAKSWCCGSGSASASLGSQGILGVYVSCSVDSWGNGTAEASQSAQATVQGPSLRNLARDHTTLPKVLRIGLADSDTTFSTTRNCRITAIFDTAIDGLDASMFSVQPLAGGAVPGVVFEGYSPASDSGTFLFRAASDGDFRWEFTPGPGSVDFSGNPILADTFTGVVRIDTIRPRLTFQRLSGSSPPADAPVAWSITTSEPLRPGALAGSTLQGTAVAGARLDLLQVGPTEYRLTVSPPAAGFPDGTVSFWPGAAWDLAGLPVDFNAPPGYTIEARQPSIAFTENLQSPRRVYFSITAQASESLNTQSLNSSRITLFGSVADSLTARWLQDGALLVVAVAPRSGANVTTGTLGIRLLSGAVQDQAGKPSTEVSTGLFQIDNVRPTVVLEPDFSNAPSVVRFHVRTSEPSPTRLTLGQHGWAFELGGSDFWRYAVTAIAWNGTHHTVTLSLKPKHGVPTGTLGLAVEAGTFADEAGNQNVLTYSPLFPLSPPSPTPSITPTITPASPTPAPSTATPTAEEATATMTPTPPSATPTPSVTATPAPSTATPTAEETTATMTPTPPSATPTPTISLADVPFALLANRVSQVADDGNRDGVVDAADVLAPGR